MNKAINFQELMNIKSETFDFVDMAVSNYNHNILKGKEYTILNAGLYAIDIKLAIKLLRFIGFIVDTRRGVLGTEIRIHKKFIKFELDELY